MKKNKSEKILGFLICFFFILKPFYLYESGLPQIADFIFCIFIIITLRKFEIRNIKENKYVLYFMFYSLVINLFFSIKYIQEIKSFIFSTIFITFLGFGYLGTYNFLKQKTKNKYYYYWGTILTTIIQTLIMIFLPSKSTRETLFFNNPNQLGYFFLLNIIIFIFLTIENKVYKINKIISYIIPILNLLLIVLSQSRAAMGSTILLLLFYFWKIEIIKLKNIKKLCLILILTCIIVGGIQYQKNINLVKIVETRIENASKKTDNNMAGRGYDRIYIYPQYLMFGSGEGGFSRYKDSRIHHYGEIHSMFGTVIFSYGLIGLYLFYKIFKKTFKKQNFVYIFSVILYNITHNGIRNQLLWILLCLICLKESKKRKVLK